jgi:hypothetical protein
MRSYTIKVNGLHLSGLEGDYGKMIPNYQNPHGYSARSGIDVSENELDGVVVQGVRNLKSYVDKVFSLEGVDIDSFEFKKFKDK